MVSPRMFVPGALVALALAVACSGEGAPAPKCPNGPESCVCERTADCGSRAEWACIETKCTHLCRSASDCAANEVCEAALCRKAGCAVDAECDAGQQCLGGRCAAPIPASRVASCSVQPSEVLLAPGASVTLSIAAKTEEGRGLAYQGAVTWASGDTDLARVSGSSVTGTARAAGDGTVELKASIPGGPECTPARGHAYGEAPAGRLRVVTADLQSGTPIANAKIVVSGAGAPVSAKTDARGVAALEVPAGAVTVSAFEPLHSYVTAFGVRSRDVVLFLKPFPSRIGFTGKMTRDRFDPLPKLGENVHLALFGSSLPGNILDLQAATVFGDLIPTHMTFGALEVSAPLPSGVVIGVNDDMFRENYEVFAPPGLRTVWGLGGNANFSELFKVLAPLVVDGADVSPGSLVGLVLPLLNQFQSGVLTGLRAPEDGTLAPIDVKLDTAARLVLRTKVPKLPSYFAGGERRPFEGALVAGGALHRPQGIVPLGLSAGLDAKEEGGARDGLVTNPEAGGIDGVLPVRLASLHDGLESSPYLMVALAANFSTIGPSGGSEPTILSGLLQVPDDLRYAPNGSDWAFPREFLGVPDAPKLAGRHFTLGGAVAGAAFHRLDIGSAWNGEWQIYFPTTMSELDIPVPPLGYDDRLLVPEGAEPIAVLVQSVRLDPKAGALDYEGVLAFDDANLDDLNGRLDAFSSRELAP